MVIPEAGTDYRRAEAELAPFAAAYFQSEFEPFPTVDAAYEALTETCAYLSSAEAEAFLIELMRRLCLHIASERQAIWEPAPEEPTSF